MFVEVSRVPTMCMCMGGGGGGGLEVRVLPGVMSVQNQWSLLVACLLSLSNLDP